MFHIDKWLKGFYYFKIYSKIYAAIFQLKLKQIHYQYKIISLGTYCLPRVITTINNLKPTKEKGEKTCPFDLAFFNDVDAIIKLLDTDFSFFFDDLEYDDKRKWWINPTLNSLFNHDGNLTKKQFVERYKLRIDNFKTYMKDERDIKFFIMATFTPVSNEQLNKLQKVLNEKTKNFKIIIINQSKHKIKYKDEKVYFINYDYSSKLFRKFNKNGNWVNELKCLKKVSAVRFYYNISIELVKIMQRVNNTD